jgi:hypothetical protein
MIRALIFGGLLSIMALNIGSTERDIVDEALRYGQCYKVEKVINCDTEHVAISVKYK